MGTEPDTEEVLRAYVLGAAGAVLSLLLGAVLWLLIESRQQPALVWGGVEYTSKQDFASYLSSRGADYKTWVLRHPGAAPWEPAPARRAVVPTRNASTAAPTAGEAGESWAERLPLAPLGLIVASGCALLLTLRRLRPVARLRRAGAALLTARRRGHDGAGGRSVLRKRVARAPLRAARRFRPSIPRFAEPTTVVAREEERLLSRVVRGRTINAGDVAFGLLTLMAGGLFALYVALLLSA